MPRVPFSFRGQRLAVQLCHAYLEYFLIGHVVVSFLLDIRQQSLLATFLDYQGTAILESVSSHVTAEAESLCLKRRELA